jgi:hypothetical protein
MSNFLTDPATKSSVDHFNRQLSRYSLAAAIAGVSVLALAQPAESEVIVTKKTIPIPLSPGTETIPISLNNDGINDFSFSLYSFSYKSFRRSLRMWPLEGGAVVAQTSARHNVPSALALVRGAKIGPSAHFSNDKFANIEESNGGCSAQRSTCQQGFSGLWGGNPKNRFLGVRFLINGETHYGWIRLTVTTPPGGIISAMITGYAYETIANKPIEAGTAATTAAVQARPRQARPSLGMLAAGAEGMPLWRREEASVLP